MSDMGKFGNDSVNRRLTDLDNGEDPKDQLTWHLRCHSVQLNRDQDRKHSRWHLGECGCHHQRSHYIEFRKSTGSRYLEILLSSTAIWL
jgi:hypothetical protein